MTPPQFLLCRRCGQSAPVGARNCPRCGELLDPAQVAEVHELYAMLQDLDARIAAGQGNTTLVILRATYNERYLAQRAAAPTPQQQAEQRWLYRALLDLDSRIASGLGERSVTWAREEYLRRYLAIRHVPGSDAGVRSIATVPQWEYMQTSLPFPPKATGMLMSTRLGTEAKAKAFFWSELNSSQFFMSYIQRQLQPLYDQGWQPTYQLGPANVQTRTRRIFMQDPVQWILIIITAATGILIPVSLAALLYNYRPAYEPSGFTIELKRART
jgi:hypothetical protein